MEADKAATAVIDAETRKMIFQRDASQTDFIMDTVPGYVQRANLTLEQMITQPLTDLAAINERLDAIGELVQDKALRKATEKLTATMEMEYARLYSDVELMAKASKNPSDYQWVTHQVYSLHVLIREFARAGRRLPSTLEKARYKSAGLRGVAHALDAFFSSHQGELVREFFRYMHNAGRKIGALEKKFDAEENGGDAKERTQAKGRLMVEGVAGSLDVERLRAYQPALEAFCQLYASIYPYLALAAEAVEGGYVRPEFVHREQNCLVIDEGRWNVSGNRIGQAILGVIGKVPVEQFEEEVVPNSTFLDSEHRVEVVEGPNNSGKTFYLFTVPYIAARALAGNWVPATRAVVSVRDRIIIKMKGTGSSISALQEDCMSTNAVIPQNGEYWLVCLDETFRSTEAKGGEALTAGVINTIGSIESVAAQGHSLLLISNHYPGLHEAYEGNPVVQFSHFPFEKHSDKSEPCGFRVEFPHRKQPGPQMDYSYAIAVARSSGFNETVLRYAEQWLQQRQQAKQ